jgi:endonuclease YncB( thermonuclease family)
VSAYPQHDTLALVKDVSSQQGDLIEWMVSKGYIDLYGDITTILAEYHGIDLAALEREKRAMLAAIRAEG